MNLVPDSDPILKEIMPEFDWSISRSELQDIFENMYQVMEDSSGIGLAAPQVGLHYRWFLMHNTSLQKNDRIFINPKILKTSSECWPFKEGCLSFPDKKVFTRRPKKIQVEYYDMDGNVKKRFFSDIWAICFQHELDHLNGVTFQQYENL